MPNFIRTIHCNHLIDKVNLVRVPSPLRRVDGVVGLKKSKFFQKSKSKPFAK